MTERTDASTDWGERWAWYLDFLEDHEDLVDSTRPPQAIPERERIEGYLKSPFKTPTDTNGEYEQTDFGSLIGAFAEMGEVMVALQVELLSERYLEFARGDQLDLIGEEIFIERWDGESDTSYRRRVKAGYREVISAGTIDEIRESVAELLDTDIGNVEVVEDHESDVATFDVNVDQTALDNSVITESYLDEHIRKMRAAGVLYGSPDDLEGGWFEFRSEAEYQDDPEDTELGPHRGFGEGRWYDYPSTGG